MSRFSMQLIEFCFLSEQVTSPFVQIRLLLQNLTFKDVELSVFALCGFVDVRRDQRAGVERLVYIDGRHDLGIRNTSITAADVTWKTSASRAPLVTRLLYPNYL